MLFCSVKANRNTPGLREAGDPLGEPIISFQETSWMEPRWLQVDPVPWVAFLGASSEESFFLQQAHEAGKVWPRDDAVEPTEWLEPKGQTVWSRKSTPDPPTKS